MFKEKSFEDEIADNMESIQNDLFSIPKFAQEKEDEEPAIPELFPESEAVKLLAKNEWQLPLEKLTQMLGWGSNLNIDELQKQLGPYFKFSEDISNTWVILSDYGKEVLNQAVFGLSENSRFDEEKPGIEERESLELFEDEGNVADDWEDEK